VSPSNPYQTYPGPGQTGQGPSGSGQTSGQTSGSQKLPDESWPKVKLIKGFTHNGHEYKAGDQFQGPQWDIDDLVRQGYAEDPNKQKQQQSQSGKQQTQSSGQGASTSRPSGP
jgi:hypothetical protein